MLDSFKIVSPGQTSALELRDQFLASTMRDRPLAWQYRDEYPIVLHPSAAQLSHCIYQGQILVAHATIWQRTLKHISKDQTIPIALIGNVATHPDYRGIGLQRQLLEHLEKIALSQGSKALVLWSDLTLFYQKLGFSSNGREIRYGIRAGRFKHAPSPKKVKASTLSDHNLVTMLKLRPELEWTLDRSAAEFRTLLSIPECHLFLNEQDSQILSWCVIGKGSDMAGVIHEWGARRPQDLLDLIQGVLRDYKIEQLLLLAPLTLTKAWKNSFDTASSFKEEHPMALAKTLTPASSSSEDPAQALKNGFIWGLDSI